jgi:hypothetical protein
MESFFDATSKPDAKVKDPSFGRYSMKLIGLPLLKNWSTASGMRSVRNVPHVWAYLGQQPGPSMRAPDCPQST